MVKITLIAIIYLQNDVKQSDVGLLTGHIEISIENDYTIIGTCCIITNSVMVARGCGCIMVARRCGRTVLGVMWHVCVFCCTNCFMTVSTNHFVILIILFIDLLCQCLAD